MILTRKQIATIGALVSVLGGLTGFYQVAVANAKSKALEVEEALKAHITDERSERAEIRQDIKALYKFLLTNQRQERLEKDGGQ